jgi:hypothetical protein
MRCCRSSSAVWQSNISLRRSAGALRTACLEVLCSSFFFRIRDTKLLVRQSRLWRTRKLLRPSFLIRHADTCCLAAGRHRGAHAVTGSQILGIPPRSRARRRSAAACAARGPRGHVRGGTRRAECVTVVCRHVDGLESSLAREPRRAHRDGMERGLQGALQARLTAPARAVARRRRGWRSSCRDPLKCPVPPFVVGGDVPLVSCCGMSRTTS